MRCVFERRLFLGAMIGLFVLANASHLQASSTSEGPKFQKVGERSGAFSRVRSRDTCQFVSHNLRFCAAGSDWGLEREPVPDEQALYQFSESHRASLTVVPMKENASSELTSVEVADLLKKHIFADGPRGKMDLVAIVEDDKTSRGRLLHRRAVVTDTSGLTHLLQVTILTFDYGLGFLETTIAVPAAGETPIISEEDMAFHKEFLRRTRISTSIYR
ncbi:MAG: hypothetical protein ABJ246_22365 [Paracoccaceae bacterium]